MNAKEIEIAMDREASKLGCFVVDVEISRDNDVTVTIEKDEGVVTMDDCVALSNAFEGIFDRNVEDYSLTVTSAGLDQPFKTLRQYLKAVGTEVEARLKGGRKIIGTLTAADEGSVTIRYMAPETVEGKKKKVMTEHEDTFAMGEVNTVIPHIDFE